MRRLLVIGAVIALTAADCRSEKPTVQEILALEGTALWEAADDLEKENLSSADLIKIVRRLVADPNKSRADSLDKFALSNCFQAACNKANAAELQELIEIYVSFDHESFEKQFDFPHLAARWIQEQLKTIDCGREKDPVTNKTPITVPAELEGSAPELAEAWKAYRALVHPVEQTVYSDSSRNSAISFQANERAFFKLLDDVLLRRGERLAERLVKFDWSGSCGTGSELVTEPRSIAILMALLSERRMPEALGAAMLLRIDDPLITGDTNVRVELLRKCGVDWEEVFAGAQIESERYDVFGSYYNPVLEELAGFGSDRAATFVGIMARQAKPALRQAYANAIAAFLTEGSTKHLRFSNGVYDRISKVPISKPIKHDLVKVLLNFAKPGISADLAGGLLDGFARTQTPEIKPALYALTKHPSPRVAEQAADVLRMMGEKIAPPIPAPPVRFRIVVNDEPMVPGSEIWWDVGGMTSTSRISRDGTLHLERSIFLEPDRKATRVILSSNAWRTKTAEGPTFHVDVPIPPDFDLVTEVNVKLFSFPLTVHSPKGPTNPQETKAYVRIQQRSPQDLNEPAGRFIPTLDRRFDVALAHPVILSLQSGDYEIVVTSSGAARLVKQVTVPLEPASLDIQLSAGSDLRYELLRPDGEKRAPVELVKDGQRVSDLYYDSEVRTFRWLPPGSYVLRIPSSKDLGSGDGDFVGYGPANIPWSSRDIAFTITPESPPIIDLGKITLEPAPN